MVREDGRGWGKLTNIKHDTSGPAAGVEGKDSLDTHIHGWGVEGLKQDLGHLFTVSFGVEGGFAHQAGVLLWGHTKLVVEGMMPNLLHIVPVCDDAVLDGVLEGEDTSLALGLVAYIGVLLTHTHHDTLENTRQCTSV